VCTADGNSACCAECDAVLDHRDDVFSGVCALTLATREVS